MRSTWAVGYKSRAGYFNSITLPVFVALSAAFCCVRFLQFLALSIYFLTLCLDLELLSQT